MRPLMSIATALCLLASVDSQATQQWTGCETIVGISNYLAVSGEVILALSPAVSGCSPNGIPGAIKFTTGVDGVAANNIQSLLASSLAGYTTGKQVMVYYDNSSVNCPGMIVANGGDGGQCL